MAFASALVGLTVTLGIGTVCRADEQARQIVDKAIDAMGGAQKLAKQKAVTFKEKGTYYGMGDGLPYTGSYAIQGRDQFRMEIEGAFVMVVNRDQGWIKMGDDTMAMTKEQLDSQKEDLYAGWVATLLPLKDKEFQLSPLGEVAVDDRAALGVKVSRKDHHDVKLYFDKESGVLVKMEATVNSPEQGGKEVGEEVFYKQYQDVDGAKAPAKMVVKRDGKQFVEAELFEFKAVGKLDDSVFAMP